MDVSIILLIFAFSNNGLKVIFLVYLNFSPKISQMGEFVINED